MHPKSPIRFPEEPEKIERFPMLVLESGAEIGCKV
jgi:hypothetical protein